MFGETTGHGRFAARRSNQFELATRMVKALQTWLEANGLRAIAAGILGTVRMISVLPVCGGYLIVRALS
jgi:hypothetical protein